MKIYTQNIFPQSGIRCIGISKSPMSTELLKLKLISKRTKFGKFFKKLESLLNGENCTIAIFDYNRYGYVSLVIEVDDKFQPLQKDLEQIGWRSCY